MHEQMAAMRAAHPDWTWNRSAAHVFLGLPNSLDVCKSVVEPGNCFSPGVGTFGVSLWVYDHHGEALTAPERLPLDAFDWSFEEGFLPILRCDWDAGRVRVRTRLAATGDVEWGRYDDLFAATVENYTERDAAISVFLVVRSFGPAGGPVRQIGATADQRGLQVNGQTAILCEEAPTGIGAVSYGDDRRDVEEFLQRGLLPPCPAVEDASTWASAALGYRRALSPGETTALSWLVRVHPKSAVPGGPGPAARPLRTEERLTGIADTWRAELTRVRLTVPDERFRDAFYTQLTHALMQTVHHQVRISPISYPLGWLRDGVYIVNALDKGGFTDFTRRALEEIAPRDAFGGFGAEGDGPGEGIWALTDHALLTADAAWLERVYPHLRRRAELIVRLRHAERPVRIYAEPVTPAAMLRPDTDLVALPARDGLIVGRMDWHYPLFWVNAFALLGLTRAAQMARLLDRDGDAHRYGAEAAALREALQRAAATEFGKNERDVTSALWPTRAFRAGDPVIREAFERWWHTVRQPEGVYRPEPLWSYFEVGQAHNYLFLGERERVWRTLEQVLTHHVAPGLYTYHEGDGDENSSGLWQRVRGWDRIPHVTPHGWTGAELFLLLRDAMLYEEEGELVIGAGVPASWFESGKPFGIAGAPTYFGRASWQLTPEGPGWRLTVSTERGAEGYRVCLPLPPGARLIYRSAPVPETDGAYRVPAKPASWAAQIVAL